MPFTVALCPWCTPTLLTALAAGASIGSFSFAIVLMLAFGVGRSAPVIIGAVSLSALQSLSRLRRWQPVFDRLAGITLLAIGAYLIHDGLIAHG